MRFFRDNGLALFFGGLFLVTLGGEAGVAHHLYNQEQAAHGEATIGFFRYLMSSDFGSRIMENWQSEFLQFATLIVAAAWLVQRGSPESKPITQRRADGSGSFLYDNSLGLLMGALFFGTWLAQSLTSWNVFNSDQQVHNDHTVSWIGYLGTADFWDRSLQNWQSEFLAVGSMAIFAVYLRQRGSPESKPVGAPNRKTGT